LKTNKKKMIAPIIVSVVVILYYVVYFGALISVVDGLWRLLLGIVTVILSAVMGMVCIERINEIKKGEEDDISKY